MKKPANIDFEVFTEAFERASSRAGKRSSTSSPTSSRATPAPISTAMIELALFLKRNGYRPDQVQDFIPSPMDVATSMYYTGSIPARWSPSPSRKNMRDRRFQRALLQFFKPENYFEVRQALLEPPGAPTSSATAATRSSPRRRRARRSRRGWPPRASSTRRRPAPTSTRAVITTPPGAEGGRLSPRPPDRPPPPISRDPASTARGGGRSAEPGHIATFGTCDKIWLV